MPRLLITHAPIILQVIDLAHVNMSTFLPRSFTAFHAFAILNYHIRHKNMISLLNIQTYVYIYICMPGCVHVSIIQKHIDDNEMR